MLPTEDAHLLGVENKKSGSAKDCPSFMVAHKSSSATFSKFNGSQKSDPFLNDNHVKIDRASMFLTSDSNQVIMNIFILKMFSIFLKMRRKRVSEWI